MSSSRKIKVRAISRLLKSPGVIPSVLRNYLSILVFKKRVLRNLQLAITYDCQYNCFLCAAKHLNKGSDTLNTGQILKIVKEAKDLGCININLTGGEPLLHQELGKIVRIISKNGLMAGLITNGRLIERDLLRSLKKNGLTELAISIHGDEEYHDNFTGIKGAYRKAVRSIEIAKSINLNVVINTVITHSNLNNQGTEDIKRLARFYNIAIQPIPICFPDKNLIDKKFILDKEDLQNLEVLLKDSYVRPLHHNYFGSACPAGGEYIYIGAYGDVFMCDLVQIPFGNVLREPLTTLWQRMLSRRKDIGFGQICIGLKNDVLS